MSTLEEFMAAPPGSTASGQSAIKTFDDDAMPWMTRGYKWLSDKEMAENGYVLDTPAPKTAREALDLAWELAHPVKEGQVIPKGTDYLVRYGKGERPAPARTGSDRFASEYDEARARTMDPLPEPTPDWLDAPAVLAFVKGHGGDPQVFERENKTGTQWLRDTKVYRWDELTVVTPLYPKEDA